MYNIPCTRVAARVSREKYENRTKASTAGYKNMISYNTQNMRELGCLSFWHKYFTFFFRFPVTRNIFNSVSRNSKHRIKRISPYTNIS